MTEGTYEQLRDSATGEAGDAWRRKDRAESELRTLYRTLKEDPRYTEEHKAEKAWCTRFETDHGLWRDPSREVWAGRDGLAYDAPPRERVG